MGILNFVSLNYDWFIVFSGAALYIGYAVVLALGRVEISREPNFKKSVSLIVPARNEESTIPRLLIAIEKIDYPKDKLEIILVDHSSTDNTKRLMDEFASQSRFKVKVISFNDGNQQQSCKSFALLAGIAESQGELYIFTDADASFMPQWIAYLSGMTTEFDLVGGAVVIEGSSFYNMMERMDWIYLCSAGAGFAGLGKPQSLFGKNMAVEADLYQYAGGFPNNKVWTEDLEFVKRCLGKGIIGFTLAKECAVYGLPSNTIKAFFRQKIRWLKGGVKARFPGFFAMLVCLIMNAAIVFSMFNGIAIFLVSLLLRSLADLIILGKPMLKLGFKKEIIYIPLYSAFAVCYQTALILLAPIVYKPEWR